MIIQNLKQISKVNYTMIKIAVPTHGNEGLNEVMSSRFGRCNTFTFVTIEDDQISKVKSIDNIARGGSGGVGIQATQIIGNNHATEVIVDFLGPNAANSLNALNIKIYHAPKGELTVKELIDMRLKEELHPMTSANVNTHQGMGQGMGQGR